jgi:DNA (cytosine-5)-methyltransferase 1
MRHGSLFSGIGGFDLAAEWMGWENVFHCEWNPFGQKILKHYWPNAIGYEDITKTDFTIHRGSIDILTGGFPCQPYSMAGKRLGKEDDRHLWPEMLRAIREIQPTWVVGENVFGLVNWNDGLVFHEVQTDLEAQGYEVQPYVLPAASVNAPHLRQRVWFVANSGTFRLQQRKASRTMGEGQEEICGEGNQSTLQSSATSEVGNAADSQHTGLEGQYRQRQGCSINRCDKGVFVGAEDKFDAADPDTQRGVDRNSRHWEEFPTQSPICGRDDGIPTQLDGITFSKWRNESIKAYGNAVVPQVVHQIFKAIQQYEDDCI